jgi:hypothetical protein
MHNFLATIITGLIIMGSTVAHDVVQLPTNVAELLHSNSAISLSYSRHAPPAQTASAAAAQSTKREITQPGSSPTPPPHDVIASPRVVSNLGSGQVLGASTAQPVIQNVYQTVSGGVSEAELNSRLNALTASFGSQLYGPSYPTPASTPNDGGLLGVIGMIGRIDNLSGTKLSDISVSGVSGLTDADIPDGITASNYLPLSGGVLSGDLSIGGNFTVSGVPVRVSELDRGSVDPHHFVVRKNAIARHRPPRRLHILQRR